MKSTKEIIDHHLKAFAEQDLKGVLSDYAPDATMLTPQGGGGFGEATLLAE